MDLMSVVWTDSNPVIGRMDFTLVVWTDPNSIVGRTDTFITSGFRYVAWIEGTAGRGGRVSSVSTFHNDSGLFAVIQEGLVVTHSARDYH